MLRRGAGGVPTDVQQWYAAVGECVCRGTLGAPEANRS